MLNWHVEVGRGNHKVEAYVRGAMKMAKTVDAVEILKNRYGHLPGFDQGVAQECINVRVAMEIYQARQEAGLSQQQLAELVGTSQQAISRLEDADYDGHSLSMLQRIGAALNKRVEIRLVSTDALEAGA